MTQMNRDRGSNDGGELQERVVQIRRVAKVVKGGRHLTFNAMVVIGDGKGTVGAGLGKGAAVPDAVRKGTTIAKQNMVKIPLKDNTIPHAVRAHFGASNVLMKPAQPGSGVKAGGAVRAVMEAVGVKDVVAKALGSRNPINVVKATIVGLRMLQGSAELDSDPAAMFPVLSPERRGPLRREGGGGFRGRDRDRDRRPPLGARPPRDDGPPRGVGVAPIPRVLPGAPAGPGAPAAPAVPAGPVAPAAPAAEPGSAGASGG